MTTASDNFNRANETPIASPWATTIGGGANLATNALTSVSTIDKRSHYTGAWADDHESSGTVGNLATSSQYAILTVRADAGGNCFGVYTDGVSGAGHTEFDRWTLGVQTTLNAIATTFVNGDLMRLTVTGQIPAITLTAYKWVAGAWSQVGQQTGIAVGPASGDPGAGAYGVATLDDWNGTDGGGGGSTLMGQACV